MIYPYLSNVSNICSTPLLNCFQKIKVVVEPGNTKKIGDVSDVNWWRRIITLFFQLPVVLVQVFQVQEMNGFVSSGRR